MPRMALGFTIPLCLSHPCAGTRDRAIVECDAVHGRHSSTLCTDEAHTIPWSAASCG